MIIKRPTSELATQELTPDIFLAGPISGAENWQEKAEQLLGSIEQTEDSKEGLVIANPRRAEGIPRVGDIAKEQITWEHRNLKLARVVMFYFVKGPGIITPLELGKELGRGSSIVLGIDESFDRPFDIEMQAHLEQPELPIYHTLDETVVAAAALARQIRAEAKTEE